MFFKQLAWIAFTHKVLLFVDCLNGTSQSWASHTPPTDIHRPHSSPNLNFFSALSTKKRAREYNFQLCGICVRADHTGFPSWAKNTDNLLLMAAILWIVTTFACVRQPSSFSVSTTRQWSHFTWLQDYGHNETQCWSFQSILRALNEQGPL